MKTVLVCSQTSTTRDRLLEELSQAFVVQAVHTHNDVLEHVRETPTDIILAEARRDHFADFLRRILEMRPEAAVHLFQDSWVFCHYPLKRPSHALMHAVDGAGLAYPSGLVRRSGAPRTAEDRLVINA
jgi:hypothetical protein